MGNPRNYEDKKRIIKIKIRNADAWAATWITYYLYNMVDKNEIESLSVQNVLKAKKSVDLDIEVLWFLAGYATSRGLDYSMRMAYEKIRRMLIRWKKKRKNKRLDIYFDGESIV